MQTVRQILGVALLLTTGIGGSRINAQSAADSNSARILSSDVARLLALANEARAANGAGRSMTFLCEKRNVKVLSSVDSPLIQCGARAVEARYLAVADGMNFHLASILADTFI